MSKYNNRKLGPDDKVRCVKANGTPFKLHSVYTIESVHMGTGLGNENTEFVSLKEFDGNYFLSRFKRI